MPRKGSGGWIKRRKHKGVTTTFNTKKGYTFSSSQGTKAYRVTFSWLPNGKLKQTVTRNNGGFFNRTTKTYGNINKPKSLKATKFKSYKPTRTRRARRGKANIFVILSVLIVILMVVFL